MILGEQPRYCYKCNGRILDDYPSHLCWVCRQSLTAPQAKVELKHRLDAKDIKFGTLENIQIEVCKMVGYAAKRRGRMKDWRKTQTLYWQGHPIDRHGVALNLSD